MVILLLIQLIFCQLDDLWGQIAVCVAREGTGASSLVGRGEENQSLWWHPAISLAEPRQLFERKDWWIKSYRLNPEMKKHVNSQHQWCVQVCPPLAPHNLSEAPCNDSFLAGELEEAALHLAGEGWRSADKRNPSLSTLTCSCKVSVICANFCAGGTTNSRPSLDKFFSCMI